MYEDLVLGKFMWDHPLSKNIEAAEKEKVKSSVSVVHDAYTACQDAHAVLVGPRLRLPCLPHLQLPPSARARSLRAGATPLLTAAHRRCLWYGDGQVLTEWDEFKTLDWQRIFNSMVKPAFVFDGREHSSRLSTVASVAGLLAES